MNEASIAYEWCKDCGQPLHLSKSPRQCETCEECLCDFCGPRHTDCEDYAEIRRQLEVLEEEIDDLELELMDIEDNDGANTFQLEWEIFLLREERLILEGKLVTA